MPGYPTVLLKPCIPNFLWLILMGTDLKTKRIDQRLPGELGTGLNMIDSPETRSHCHLIGTGCFRAGAPAAMGDSNIEWINPPPG
jgi:hypothetical protein